ncbi:MAG: holo-ACP synthase [Lentisphaerae bacterium]|nr:holo-ACP synthase [Lentisphaerota bacterium]
MKIIGLGTDIVEIARLKAVLDRFDCRFRERVYTVDELILADTKSGHIPYFAGRWAAKEAAAKALGCGIGENCAFTDIEILNDDHGRPVMSFSGAAAELAASLGVTDIKLSISHETNYAVATVVICGKQAE